MKQHSSYVFCINLQLKLRKFCSAFITKCEDYSQYSPFYSAHNIENSTKILIIATPFDGIFQNCRKRLACDSQNCTQKSYSYIHTLSDGTMVTLEHAYTRTECKTFCIYMFSKRPQKCVNLLKPKVKKSITIVSYTEDWRM